MADDYNLRSASPSRITFVHNQVHSGNAFTFSHIFTGVASSASVDILFKLGALQAHTAIEVAVGEESTVVLYEAPTTSADGTSLSVVNLNRASTNTSLHTAHHTPTVSDAGTAIMNKKMPGTSGLGVVSIGSVVSSALRGMEWIFAPSTNYLLRTTNDSASATDVAVQMVYYETLIPPRYN